jgi:uncharacterized membrane protein required for colicin V production
VTGSAWPDVVIVMILAVGAIKGFSRGFVAELGGLAAVAAALIVPWYYNGAADGQIESLTKLAAGPAHVAGMILTGAVAYVVVIVLASILGRIAKLPLLGTGNAIAGALAGAVKGALLVWIVLFVALLFPLTPPIRTALHQSRLVPYFTEFDGAIDVALARAVPSFARPLFGPLFDPHRR